MRTNEFGIGLSRAGYAPSILEPARACCAVCGRRFGAKLDRHEPWGGANREKSKALGLWVSLCHWGCHEGPGSVHDDPALARELRRRAQAQAMCVYGWDLEEWRRRFGKSELGEGEDPYIARTAAAVRESGLRGTPDAIHGREPVPPVGPPQVSDGGLFHNSGFAVLAGPELPF